MSQNGRKRIKVERNPALQPLRVNEAFLHGYSGHLNGRHEPVGATRRSANKGQPAAGRTDGPMQNPHGSCATDRERSARDDQSLAPELSVVTETLDKDKSW